MEAFRRIRVAIVLITILSTVFAFLFDLKDADQGSECGPSKISYWVLSGVTFLVGFGWQSGVDGSLNKYKVKHPWLYLGFFAYASLISLGLVIIAPILALEGPFFPSAGVSIGIVFATLLAIETRRKQRTEQDGADHP